MKLFHLNHNLILILILFINLNKYFNLFFYRDKNFILIFNISKDFFIRTLCIVLAEFVLINNSAKLGNNYLAVIQIYIVFLSFISYGLDSFAHSAETLLGQAFGKKDKITSLIVIIKTLVLAVILAVFLSAILLILGNYSFFLFTSIESLIKTKIEVHTSTLRI